MRLTIWALRAAVDRTSKLLDYYSQFHPSVLSIQQFIDFATTDRTDKEQNSFVFLRKELPVRYANIMKEIHLLPDQLVNQPSVKLVQTWYEQNFQNLVGFEKSDANDKKVLEKFSDVLDAIRTRNQSVVETMAMGVMELKEQGGFSGSGGSGGDEAQFNQRVQYFLDRFYMSRIGIRMLMHQHLILFAKSDRNTKHIGCIDPECDLMAVARDAYENARFLCDQYYSTSAPSCDFISHNSLDRSAGPTDKISMTYVPSHLYHILFELFKNALRAVVEFHGNKDQLPKLQLFICKGREDVTIKLSDQGGGIRRSEINLLFDYMYSTAPRPTAVDINHLTPLAGFGYGLPLSRLYAKYFQGDLQLNSIDGYGTDAMLFLKFLPCDASELLPIYNKTSSLRYTGSRQIQDWSEVNRKNIGDTHPAKH